MHDVRGGLGLLWRWGLTRMDSVPSACAALVIGIWARPDSWPRYVLAAWLVLILLRYADDTADRTRDRKQHPQRVLPQAPWRHVAAAGVLLLILVPAALVLLLGKLPVGTIALAIGAGLFYSLRALMTSAPESLVWRHLLMLKYPALLLALTPDVSWPALIALLGGAAFYELAHDRRCRQARGFIGWLAADTALLAAAGLWFFKNGG